MTKFATPIYLLLALCTQVLNAQDSSGVIMIASYSNDWDMVQGLDIVDNYLFVAAGYMGFSILNISDPRNPTEVGSLHFDGNAYSVSVIDTLAFVTDGENGLRILNISDLENPLELSLFRNRGIAINVEVVDNFAYYTNAYGVVILNIEDLSHPEETAFFPLRDTNDLEVVGDYCFATAGSGGLHILDISNPWEPVEVGHSPYGLDLWGVYVLDEYAYMVSLNDNLTILDISNPTDPVRISSRRGIGSCIRINLHDNFAFVSAFNDGLRILNISDPTDPKDVGYYDTGHIVFDVAVGQNGLAFIATSINLCVVDCSEALGVPEQSSPLYPTLLSLEAFPNPFNSSTTIRFVTGRNAHPPRIAIYGLDGKIAAELIGGRGVLQYAPTSGSQVIWNASGFPAGSYFVRLEAGKIVRTEKVILIK